MGESGRYMDPLSVVRSLVGWDPFREAESFRGGGMRNYKPEIELKETKDAYVFKADLPGVDENDLDISVVGNRITISGKREEERSAEEDRYYAYECSYGTFSRSFTLPAGADVENVTADIKCGVLTVNVPKKAEVQPRRINVGASTGARTTSAGQTPAATKDEGKTGKSG
jgi:HSP20 family protein